MTLPRWHTHGPALTPQTQRAMVYRMCVLRWTVNRTARYYGHSWGTTRAVLRHECERTGVEPLLHVQHAPIHGLAIDAICPKCGGALDFRVEPGAGDTLEVCPGSPQDGLPGCGAWYMKRRYPA